jgi:CxxC motif-containing protein (DUF1111 family)
MDFFIIFNSMRRVYLSLVTTIVLFSCAKNQEHDYVQYYEKGEEFSGGNATTFIQSRDAFGQSASGLTDLQENSFFVGNSLFNQNWVSAPASTTARDGLGPMFNAKSCSGCHFKDGRGKPPTFNGEINTGMLFKLIHGNGGDPNYGGQLQDQALPNIPVEAKMNINYTELVGEFKDGTKYTLRKPEYSITDGQYGSLQATISPRVAQQICGLGLLDAVAVSTLMEFVDEADSDGDGISGKMNQVIDDQTGLMGYGKFGWKAGKTSLINQNATAFVNDMGITSDIFPTQSCAPNQLDCANASEGGNPEIILDRLSDVTLYTSVLAVPVRRDYSTEQVLRGKKVFIDAKCNACHIQKMLTGISNINALSNQTIFPYTDLLLHDMGDELADNAQEFEANGNEWRTPPLWGIGLVSQVNEHTNFLHDGRARNIMEAVLWHGGEAEKSKLEVLELSLENRNALISFLNSL